MRLTWLALMQRKGDIMINTRYCDGCGYFHSAKRKDPHPSLKKYNRWCCAKGDVIDRKTIGWCKTHSMRKLEYPAEE